MELPGEGSDPRPEGRLQVHVDILEVPVPGQRPRLDVDPKRIEPAEQRGHLLIVEQSGAPQAPDVGDRTGEIVDRERAIDLDRPGEVGGPHVRLAAEPPAPEPHRPSPTPVLVR